jgi:hypothetical protein
MLIISGRKSSLKQRAAHECEELPSEPTCIDATLPDEFDAKTLFGIRLAVLPGQCNEVAEGGIPMQLERSSIAST